MSQYEGFCGGHQNYDCASSSTGVVLMLYRGEEDGGHRQSLPEIGMKPPTPGLADIISHVSQAKHRAAMFVSI